MLIVCLCYLITHAMSILKGGIDLGNFISECDAGAMGTATGLHLFIGTGGKTSKALLALKPKKQGGLPGGREKERYSGVG